MKNNIITNRNKNRKTTNFKCRILCYSSNCTLLDLSIYSNIDIRITKVITDISNLNYNTAKYLAS